MLFKMENISVIRITKSNTTAKQATNRGLFFNKNLQ